MVQYKLLGNTGLRVHRLTLGTMGFGQDWTDMMGIGSKESDIEKIYKKYVEEGGNFIDTANFYQFGNSERYIASLNKKFNISRDDLILATKFTLPMNKSVNYLGNSKKNLKRSVDESLKRLGTDYIDILYVHFWDFTTGTKDIMRSLNEVVKSGKVSHIGISDTPAWEVSYANAICDQYGWEPFCIYQGCYGLLDRSMENDVIPMSRKFNIGVTPWGVVGQGKLSGKYQKGQKNEEGQRKLRFPISDGDWNVIDEVNKISKEINRSSSQIAHNWVLSQPGISTLLVGPRTFEQFEDTLGSLDFTLSEEHMKRLDEVSKFSKGKVFPHTMIGHSAKDQLGGFMSFQNKNYDIITDK